jgi:hypothetical protein
MTLAMQLIMFQNDHVSKPVVNGLPYQDPEVLAIKNIKPTAIDRSLHETN